MANHWLDKRKQRIEDAKRQKSKVSHWWYANTPYSPLVYPPLRDNDEEEEEDDD